MVQTESLGRPVRTAPLGPSAASLLQQGKKSSRVSCTYLVPADPVAAGRLEPIGQIERLVPAIAEVRVIWSTKIGNRIRHLPVLSRVALQQFWVLGGRTHYESRSKAGLKARAARLCYQPSQVKECGSVQMISGPSDGMWVPSQVIWTDVPPQSGRPH